MRAFGKSRPVLSGLVAAAVGIVVFVSTTLAEDFSGREIVIHTAGGTNTEAFRTAFVEPFEKETGAKIKLVEADYDTMYALVRQMAETGSSDWDAVGGIDPPYIYTFAEEGDIRNLDYSRIKGSEALAASAKNSHGLAFVNGAVTLAYRDAPGVTPMKSVRDFFDPNVKGPRAAGGIAAESFVMCYLALAADGVKPEDMAPIDIDRCLAVWGRIKDQVTTWWTTGAEMAQVQIDEEVDYGIFYNGRIIQAAKVNPKWKLTFDGGVAFASYFTILKNTKNEDLIYAFLSSAMDPQRQAKFTETIGYAAPHPKSVDYLPPELIPFLSITPQAQAVIVNVPDDVQITNAAYADELGTRWLEFISE